MAWEVVRERADAASLHSWAVPFDRRLVRVCEVTGPAVVLGSTQSSPNFEGLRGSQPDNPSKFVPFVRRRSGGGAVWVAPGDPLWVDVVVPRGDPLWSDDVVHAFWWLGDAWAAALADCGLSGAGVHRGPLVTTRWSRMVCFAGLGSGEVTRAGRKAVGIAQRRTREGAVFQCAVPLAWDAAPLCAALGVPEAASDLAAAAGLGAPADLLPALLSRLP